MVESDPLSFIVRIVGPFMWHWIFRSKALHWGLCKRLDFKLLIFHYI